MKVDVINDLKIIDFEKKGNVVRFYLGLKDLKRWYGDDWDDTPYEYNAGTVYEEFVVGYTDVAFDFDDLVLEPSDGTSDSGYCKDDMVARRVPCIIVVNKEESGQSWYTDFQHWACHDGVKKYYFGDEMAADFIYERPVNYDKREASPCWWGDTVVNIELTEREMEHCGYLKTPEVVIQ